MKEAENIILGSGDLYILQYDGAIPENSIIETETNKIGHIQGGASLEYKPEFYEVVDDRMAVLKRFITKEEVTFKSGILSWNMETLDKLSVTGRVSTKDNIKTVKIGGAEHYAAESWLIRFVHTLDDTRKIRVTLAGTAVNGFSLAFNADKETVIDAEFKALSQADGTLVQLDEELA